MDNVNIMPTALLLPARGPATNATTWKVDSKTEICKFETDDFQAEDAHTKPIDQFGADPFLFITALTSFMSTAHIPAAAGSMTGV